MRVLKIRFEANAPCLQLLWVDENGKQYWSDTIVYDWYEQPHGEISEHQAICEELWEDQAIRSACEPLEEEYDKTCCFDERGCFEPRGWKSEAQMKAFNQKMIDLWEFLRERLKGKYEVYIHGFFGDVNSDRADSKEPVL